jgi:hypothetical protein
MDGECELRCGEAETLSQSCSAWFWLTFFGGGALTVKKFWLSPIRASEAWALGLELTLQVGSFVVENLPHTTR